jgi:hypothetical protein
LTATDTHEWPPNVRLATLAPILMPLVMPPAIAAAALARPSRTSIELLSPRASPGRLASFAHSIASMAAISASASAPSTMTGASRASWPSNAVSANASYGRGIVALADSVPMVGPSAVDRPASTRP